MTVLNKHTHGIPAGAVYIGRGSPWGNPFVMGMGPGRDGSRSEVIAKHKAWLWEQIEQGKVSLEALAALKGKDLVCFCAPLPCHGDTLEKAAVWAADILENTTLDLE